MRTACLIGISALILVLTLGAPSTARADDSMTIVNSFPANGSGLVSGSAAAPVSLIGPNYHPTDFGYASQSISLQLGGLPLTGCSLQQSSSINSSTVRLQSSNSNDTQYYGLTNPVFGRSGSQWWLALSSSVSGFELLPHTTYTLHVKNGPDGIKVTCNNQIYALPATSSGHYSISFKTGADTVAPRIMGPQVAVTATTAVVRWETFQAASGQVGYGPTYSSTAEHDGMGRLHRVEMQNLQPGREYRYQIRSTDPAGNVGTYEGTFTTVAVSEVKVDNVTDMAATVRWKTNVLTDSLVELGPSESYGDRQGNGGQTTNHSVRLIGLKPDSTYHFRIVATNSSGTSRFGDNVFATKPLATIAGIADGSTTAGDTRGALSTIATRNRWLAPLLA